MRRALGDMGASSRSHKAAHGSATSMTSGPAWQPRQPRRFVREGEVRVETLNSQGRHGAVSPEAAALTKRLREIEAVLQLERTERERAERSLEQAMDAKRQLEMRVWHEASTRDEAEKALEAARANSLEAGHLRDALQTTQELLETSRSAEKAARRALRNMEATFEKERAALAAESEAHAKAVQALEVVRSALAATTRQLAVKKRELAEAVAEAHPHLDGKRPSWRSPR